MEFGRIVRPVGYVLIAALLIVMAGRSPLFAGDGGPYILQHDLRIDPAGDLISAVRQAIRRIRGLPVTDAPDDHLKARRASKAECGQTP